MIIFITINIVACIFMAYLFFSEEHVDCPYDTCKCVKCMSTGDIIWGIILCIFATIILMVSTLVMACALIVSAILIIKKKLHKKGNVK